MRSFFYILCVILSLNTHASIVPDNEITIPTSKKGQGLTEDQYHQLIDKFIATYKPIIEEMGKILTIRRLWEDPRVNAGATKKGKEIILNLYGGFARHPFITEDAYLLVICHELGHHFGGSPKKKDQEGKIKWASVEGQADYFATLKCLRKIFEHDDNEKLVNELKNTEQVKEKCQASFTTPSKIALCIRSIMAGVSTASISADLRNKELPSIDTPDSSIVDVTYEEHPLPQCRLDTYLQGAICRVKSKSEYLGEDELFGTCHELKGHTSGMRPGCWFKSFLERKFHPHML